MPSLRRRLLRPFLLLAPIVLVASSALADTAGMKPAAGAKPSATANGTSTSAAGLKTNAPPPATGPLAEGLDALEKSDYAAAEKSLKSVSGKDAAKATIGLARLQFETGRYEDAATTAKKAAGLAGTDLATKSEAIGWQGAATLAVGKVDEARKIVEPLRDEVKAPRARALLVEILLRVGDRDEARNVADALESDSEGDDAVYQTPSALAVVGRAAHLMRDVKYANGTFKAAFKLKKNDVETNLEWARLFLDYYDPGHAEESVRDALKVSPNNAEAHLLRAEVKLAQTFDWDEAEKELKKALDVNPRLTRAFFVRGSMMLHDGDGKAADGEVKKGLAVDAGDLDLLTLGAAIKFLDDDLAGYAKAKDAVLKKNPQYSQFFVTVGEFADWEHRYDDIVTMMKEATKIDPKDGKAWAELGFNLLRRGDEKEGRAALDEAYKHDHYNVRLVNMLNLFEKTLDKNFELDEGTGSASVFKFRLDKEEAPLLAHYLPQTMAKAWQVMVKKYGFTPKNPVQIEVYPERQDFSIRTDGLPNIGPTGVCFGRVITAVSPKKEPSNWGLVLWHELGHVFAIQLSKSHVPRWFTEGLSEYETIVTRPEWHRALDPDLYKALEAGRLPKIADMNHAFTHAKSGQDIVVAYYASSQMIVYLADTYGFPKIVDMLKLWGEGKRTPDVIQKGLGISSDDLDSGFKAWLKKRLVRYDGQFMFDVSGVPETADAKKDLDADPKNGSKAATYAAALFLDRNFKDARDAANKAVSLDGNNQVAHYLLAKLAFGLDKDVAEATKQVNAIVGAGGDGYVVENMIADLALADPKKDVKRFRTALEKAAAFDPTQIDPLIDLWQLAVDEKRAGDAEDLLKKMVKLDPHERVPWRALLTQLVSEGKWDEAIGVGEAAIYVDVYSPEVHSAYAHALTMKGRTKDAHEEIDAGLAAKPKGPGEAMLRAELARVFWKEKNAAKAKEALDAALKLDPKNADALQLKNEIK